MKHDWEYKKLGEYIKEYAVRNRKNEDIPVYSVTNSNGFCKDYFSKDVASTNKSTYKIVPYGCFAYNPSRINVGSVDWQNKEERVIVSPLYNVFSISKDLLQSYLLYYIKSNSTMRLINIKATGTVRSNLKLSMLSDFELPVPPLPTQQSIVSELDSLSKIIADCKETLKDYDALEQSIFYDMFGDVYEEDKCKCLIELCSNNDDIKCGPFGTQLSKNEYQKEGIPIYGIPQINSRFLVPPTDFVTQLKFESISDYNIVQGDIVMSRKGNIGQCCVFPPTMPQGVLHSDAIRLRFDDSIVDSIFMMYYLHLSRLVKHQVSLIGRGAIMAGLNVTKLKTIKVSVPPLPLQQQFASKIEAIEQMKSETKKALQEAETLFNARMDYWFN